MQIFNEVRLKTQQLLQENASTILTAAGVVGAVATAVLTGKAAYTSAHIILAEEGRRMDKRNGIGLDDEEVALGPLTKTEKVKLAAVHFIPPVLTGVGTVGCIVMANRISAQKAAALAAAYGLSEKQLREYKEKVEEKLTGQKKQQIEDEIAQNRASNTPGANQIVVIEGEVLCLDAAGGRYFNSTMEKIKQAVNKANESILNHDYVSLSEFYDLLGLRPTSWSDDLGFNMDNRVELNYTTTIAENGRPCIVIDFARLPKPDFHRTY